MSATDVEPCECSVGAPIPGVLGWRTPEAGVQRCDVCCRFPGDLHAAFALAVHLGKTAWFQAWASDDPEAEPQPMKVTVMLLADVNVGRSRFLIQPGTDPWLADD